MREVERDSLLEAAALNGVERQLLRGPAARLAPDGAGDRELARQVVRRFRSREKQRRVLVAAVSSLSLAAAAALVLQIRETASPQAQGAGKLATTSPFSLASGTATLPGGSSALLGQTLAADVVELLPGACVSAQRARLCAERGAKLRLPAVGAAWQVELQQGDITADLGPLPAGFAVSTLHGVASVVGTLFSVEIDSSRAFTNVLVTRGSVHCQNSKSAEAALVQAGQSARLGARLEVFGREVATVDAQSQRARGDAASADAEPKPSRALRSTAEHSPGGSSVGASELLERARQQRAARQYAAAAQTYQQLVQAHPQSAEARAALVSLGQLQLGQLGQPEAALRSFQAYLASAGQLRQEAEHGAIVALQKLGRKTEERRAIQAFLERYPKSVQAGPLSARLKQL